MTTAKKKTDSILYFSSVVLLALSAGRMWAVWHAPKPEFIAETELTEDSPVAPLQSAGLMAPDTSAAMNTTTNERVDRENGIVNDEFNLPALVGLDVNEVKARLKSLPEPLMGQTRTHQARLADVDCAELLYKLGPQQLIVSYNQSTSDVYEMYLTSPRPGGWPLKKLFQSGHLTPASPESNYMVEVEPAAFPPSVEQTGQYQGVRIITCGDTPPGQHISIRPREDTPLINPQDARFAASFDVDALVNRPLDEVKYLLGVPTTSRKLPSYATTDDLIYQRHDQQIIIHYELEGQRVVSITLPSPDPNGSSKAQLAKAARLKNPHSGPLYRVGFTPTSEGSDRFYALTIYPNDSPITQPEDSVLGTTAPQHAPA